MIAVIEDEAERLGAALDGDPRGLDDPSRLEELVALAAEIAEVLRRPSLDGEERRRILAEAIHLAARRGTIRLPRPLPAVRTRTALAAGGAAVGLAVLGVALVRRGDLPPASARA